MSYISLVTGLRNIKHLPIKFQSSWKLITILLTIFVLIGLWFYWFQWRPSNIRKKCFEYAADKAKMLYEKKVDIAPGEPSDLQKASVEQGMFLKTDNEEYYEDCLHKEGLK